MCGVEELFSMDRRGKPREEKVRTMALTKGETRRETHLLHDGVIGMHALVEMSSKNFTGGFQDRNLDGFGGIRER